MNADRTSVLEAVDVACADAVVALDGHTPTGLIVFECVGRRGVLDEAGDEIARIARHAAGAPIAGFYAYACRQRGGSDAAG